MARGQSQGLIGTRPGLGDHAKRIHGVNRPRFGDHEVAAVIGWKVRANAAPGLNERQGREGL